MKKMIDNVITGLVGYALDAGLIEQEDRIYAVNAVCEKLKLDTVDPEAQPGNKPLYALLDEICNYAVEKGIIEDTLNSRELFDTGVMGALTPRPSEVAKKFRALYKNDPVSATDWYYKLSGDTNYIRRDRIEKNLVWKSGCEYGELDITINLSKPEKDPRDIAKAKLMPQSGYPKCMLCKESAGYMGRMNFPARQNHRPVPIKINGADWFLQYSPYVYYNEHCIVFNGEHVPMKIDKSAFEKLLDFVTLFPHYFLGSNADLPIVGGSILSHEHFQGGHFEFAMERAQIETPLSFKGYENVTAGIVKWPMSTIRLTSNDKASLASLADKILTAWRGYTDENAFIYANTDGVDHNTITPIARRRGEKFELDLVLRNNITTAEHPLGVYHPHAELHHIKKENIGLIEVMGLAVLPARLKAEMAELKEEMLTSRDFTKTESLASHSDWAQDILSRHGDFCEENADKIIRDEIGLVFAKVLEHAGVYKRTDEGLAAFMRFTDSVNK